MTLSTIIFGLIRFYIGAIVIYVLMSWFPIKGIVAEIYQVLGSIVEPYLGLFRRIIPPLGMIDISPIVAILVLQLAANFLIPLLGM